VKYIVLVFSFVCLILSLSSCRPAYQYQSPVSHDPVSQQVCEKYQFLRDYQCSFEKIQKAALDGNSNAQYALGFMYYYGIEVMPNNQLAAEWIEKSARQGNMQAAHANMMLAEKDSGLSRRSGMVKAKQNRSEAYLKHAGAVIHGSACQAGHGYTIQIAGSHSQSRFKTFIQNHADSLKGKSHLYRQRRNASPWYILTYGYYPTYAQARHDLHQLPSSLSEYSPWVKSCAAVINYSE
jgi:septal ring-binding cell division protein DamX